MSNDPLLAPSRLLEVCHVAHRLSVSQRFVWDLIRKKKLAAIRLGTRWRIDPQDLQAFIDAQRVASVDRSAFHDQHSHHGPESEGSEA